VRRLGCAFPVELAWSPDSSRLAYSCPDLFTGPGAPSPLFVIRADGTGRFKVHTGTRTAFSPTWSADGKRLAFATEPRPRYELPSGIAGHPNVVHSSVYIVSLDGSHRRLLATGAAGPSWSPDGATIAYQSKCGGIRLSSPPTARDRRRPRPARRWRSRRERPKRALGCSCPFPQTSTMTSAASRAAASRFSSP